MQGTHCISGTGMGVVVATGDKTVFGRIAKLTSQPSTGSTTLEKEIFNFVIIIVSLMLFMIILVIILWYRSILAPPLSLWEYSLTIAQGFVSPHQISELDQRAFTDRRLRERGCCLHPRGPPDCIDSQFNHHREYHAKEQDPL